MLRRRNTLILTKGQIILVGNFNARIGNLNDFIKNDSLDLSKFNVTRLLPANYQIDITTHRNFQDNTVNTHGQNLIDLCISSRLRILNGRYLGDSLGYFTCLTANGQSTVDYAIVSESLLSSFKYFKTLDSNYLSDHTQIEIDLKCNIRKFDNKLHNRN